MRYLITFVLLIYIGIANTANAITIEFSTNSFVEAEYSLTVVSETELNELYSFNAGQVIDLSGLGDRFVGSYDVAGVEHSVSGEGYQTVFTLHRQGGGIIAEDGSTLFSLQLLDYELFTFDRSVETIRWSEFQFVPRVPETPLLVLLLTGLTVLVLVHSKAFS